MTVVVKAERRLRRYDKERGCYVYDVVFRTETPLTDRTLDVAEAFGLGIDDQDEYVLYDDFQLRLREGDIVYITGDSGSGKSVLLNAIKTDLGIEAITLDGSADEMPLIDQIGSTFQEALDTLSNVGLNDAYLFLKRYSELSEGQRYRFQLAKMIDSGKKYWLADEFCSTLDRVTAKVVAFNMQKQARKRGATLIVATTHTDLDEDLNPNISIKKGWGSELSSHYDPAPQRRPCSLLRDVEVQECTRKEYYELAQFHYRNHRPPVPYKFYSLTLGERVVGVIAYSYPPIQCGGRKLAVSYRPTIDELNRDWTNISRVIIHPTYRSIGLGIKMIRDTLRLQGRRHVELTAVMSNYNPFAEKAGMKKVLLQTPHKTITRATESLRELGFNPSLTGSVKHNLDGLRRLSEDGMDVLEGILLRVNSSYFKRLSRSGDPYMRKSEFHSWLRKQDLESLAASLKILNILNQCKTYLYWCRDWET